MRTPYSKKGLRKFDDLPLLDAILCAWNDSGKNPLWHKKVQDQVRRDMPVLARALGRGVMPK